MWHLPWREKTSDYMGSRLAHPQSRCGKYYRFFFAFLGGGCGMLASQHGGCTMDIQKELMAEYDRETATTRKMFEAIPADVDFNYKPHAKSMALGRLAGHVSETASDWATHTCKTNKLEFPADHKFEPYIPASKDTLLEKFDSAVVEAKAELAKMTPENSIGRAH